MPQYGVGTSGSPNVVRVSKADTTPRIAVRYGPTDTAVFYAAWTKSFRPANLMFQFNPYEPAEGFAFWDDPLHPSGETTRVLVATIDQPHNPDIKSEYGDKYSLGFDWEPESVRGLRWTVDWSRIDHTNRIEGWHSLGAFYPLTSAPHPELAIRDGNGFATTLINRPIRIESSHSLRRLYGLIYAAHPELVIRDENGFATTVVGKPINLSLVVSEMVTSSVRYSFETKLGRFEPRVTYTRVLDEFLRYVHGAEPHDRVSTADGSDEYKIEGQLTWMWGRFAADLFIYHRAGYSNDTAGVCLQVVGRCERMHQPLPTLNLGSSTTFDLTLAYEFDNGIRVRAGGRNLFRKEAPTISYGLGYDLVRWDARSRVLFLDLHWSR